MTIRDNRITFYLVVVCVILLTAGCGTALSELPQQVTSVPSSIPAQQLPVQQPSNPSPNSAQSPIQISPQPAPPVQQPVQPSQPSGEKKLNIPTYLFTEPQGAPKSNNTTGTNSDISGIQVPVGPRDVQVLALINISRMANGLAQLERNTFLDSLAQQHCQDMVRSNVLSHDGFDGRAKTIIKTLGSHTVGENVAAGYNAATTLVQGWLNSPGHRENIMKPSFRKTGIGIVGQYATQMFSD